MSYRQSKETLLRWVWLLIKHQKIYDNTNDVSLSLPSLMLLCSSFKKIKILVTFWLILVTASQQNHEMAVNHTVYPCKWGLLGTTDGWNGTLVSYTQNLIWNWYWLEYSFFFFLQIKIYLFQIHEFCVCLFLRRLSADISSHCLLVERAHLSLPAQWLETSIISSSPIHHKNTSKIISVQSRFLSQQKCETVFHFTLRWLWAAITPVQKIIATKTTIFSERPGRQLSNGIPWIPLKNVKLTHNSTPDVMIWFWF